MWATYRTALLLLRPTAVITHRQGGRPAPRPKLIANERVPRVTPEKSTPPVDRLPPCKLAQSVTGTRAEQPL